jgi:hypothetical protein
MLFSLLLSYVVKTACACRQSRLIASSFLRTAHRVTKPLRYYTKYPIDVQHFYSDCYITDCGIAICRCRSQDGRRVFCQNRQASANSYITFTCCTQPRPGVRRSLSEQTSKRPRTKGFKPIVVLPTAALQFAAAAQETAALLSEQTSKHPVNKGFQSLLLHCQQLHYTHQPLRPWTAWETFVRTDKQAVIHRLSTVCG